MFRDKWIKHDIFVNFSEIRLVQRSKCGELDSYASVCEKRGQSVQEKPVN